MLRIALCLVSTLATAVLLTGGPGDDPPLMVKLHIDGQEIQLVNGVEKQLAIGGKETKVKVVVEPHRRFQAAGLEFDFPRGMALEYDASEPESWTLDGNAVVIHVHRHEVGKAAAMMRATLVGMMATLDEEAANPVAREITLGGKKYKGLTAKATIGMASIHVTAVGIDFADYAVVLMIQDTLDDDGNESAECKRVIEMLGRTLEIKAK